MQYAFDELDLLRLTAEVFLWNDPSRRVLKNVGFQKEGRLRKHREKEGAYIDVLYYGLLETDGVGTDDSSEHGDPCR